MKYYQMLGLLLVVSLTGCQSAYYGAMEKVGINKRDIMVDRVKDARASQDEAKETIKTTLEQFSAVVEIKSGDLEKTYKRLNDSFLDTESAVNEVHSRIASIESVSGALFKEWKAEIKTYTNVDLKRKSEAQLKDAQIRYEQMIKAMKTASKQMDPVLVAFRDQVLFLKHNLNSAAISSIQGEVVKIQSDVKRLIADMEKAIAEADSFINNWQGSAN
jgi:hypothetical protein